jgi:hypothetical protein
MSRLALLLALCLLPLHATAAEPKKPVPVVCGAYYDDILGMLVAQGSPVILIPADEIPERLAQLGQESEGVTRAFVTQLPVDGKMAPVLGVEKGGCLAPPVILSGTEPPGRRGMTPAGVFA